MSLVVREEDFRWLEEEARRQIEGCRRIASDGAVLYTPDGEGNYNALWTRDFSYMVENVADMIPRKEIEAAIGYLFAGQRDDGAMPDRVRPDGTPLYLVLGDPPEPPVDNPQFMVKLTSDYVRLSGNMEFFEEFKSQLDCGMSFVRIGKNGLVYIDPSFPHSPYGFTDNVAKTGDLFFESLLYWQACNEMAKLYDMLGMKSERENYSERTKRVEKNIDLLWCEGEGAYFAASIDCRQIDIWGNAYAIYINFPCGAHRESIVRFLVDNYHRYVWRGQVRHLLKGEYWERLLSNVQPETFQNGAYWGTASGWVIYAIAQEDPHLASKMFSDLIKGYQHNGVCECVNISYRKLKNYVASATNPLGAMRRLIREGKVELTR